MICAAQAPIRPLLTLKREDVFYTNYTKRNFAIKIFIAKDSWFIFLMFLDALEQLHRWRRKHLPGAETPQGAELLVWILKNCEQGAPLKELYRSSRFSEPTVRASLKQFLAGALVTIELDAEDSRCHLVRSTPKLERTVNDYMLRIRDVAKAPLNEPRRGRTGC